LTGFADEISPELEEQLETLAQESMGYMELRSVWNTNVLDLSDDELDRVKSATAQRGIRISSIGSPIGKVPVTEPFKPHLERFRRALRTADMMEAPYVRVFSFFIPEGQEPGHYREEVIDRMGIMAGEAKASGITLLHENEKEIYGDVPSRCLDILAGVGSPALRAAWDAANFVQCGVRPYIAGYASLRPYLEYIHVKDALSGSDRVVPAGEGDGQLPETLSALHDSGFDGFFSLEPHLGEYTAFGALSGPELFTRAWRAFTEILSSEGVQYA
jgi:sugar phosphate isomerase/epimerase